MTSLETSILKRDVPVRIRSVTRTVRLDEDVDRMFQDLADKEKTSINHLVSKALRRYAEWDVHAERFGFLTIGTKQLTKLFNNLTDKEAREMGQEAGNSTWPEFIQFYHKKFNYDTVMRTLELLGHTYARMYTLESSYDSKHQVLVLKHNRGSRTSAFLAESIKALFLRLGLKPEITETEDQVTLKVQPNLVSTTPAQPTTSSRTHFSQR
jgi:hypothetical protein